MTKILELVRQPFLWIVSIAARSLNKSTRGKLHPDFITLVGIVMHIPIAVLIASHHWAAASLLLVFFGLFDKLDGTLARLQQRVTSAGGFLDATTDRIKEVMLYTGVTYVLAVGDHPATAAWAAAACGASLCVSYMRAKGEALLAAKGSKEDHNKLSKLFGSGLMQFEFRIFLLIVGLLVGQLAIAIAVIAVMASLTALRRLWDIRGMLVHAKN